MTELLGKFGDAPGFIEHRVDATTASPRPLVMISEHQVLFATAAAKRFRPSNTCLRWTAARAIAANLRSTFMASSTGARPRRQHCSSRRLFFEDSRMAREMLRL
jgi:hypothetical protein